MKFVIRVKSKRVIEDERHIDIDTYDRTFLQELGYEAALAKIEQIYIKDEQEYLGYIRRSDIDVIGWETFAFLIPRPKNLKTKSVWVKTENLKKYIG